MEQQDTNHMNNEDDLIHSQNGWNFSVAALLENYGWYLLIVAVIIAYIYRQAQPTIDKYLKDKADKEYAAKYHKNPDLAATRLAAQQRVAGNLQEKYTKQAAEYQRKMEEKETRKREDWLARQSTSAGQKLGRTPTKNEQNSLKPEYNPLMGSSSRSYRPQKKSACSGGGCGK